MKYVVLLGLLVLAAGCGEPCPSTLGEGTLVEHKLGIAKWSGVVLRESHIENLEGFCLVKVRTNDGLIVNLAASELRATE